METKRSRAWRRAIARHRGGDRVAKTTHYKPEKNWKLMYCRSAKCARALQLGFSYPILTTRQLLEQR